MSSAVAHALPPSILALFAPRAPIEYKPPIRKPKRKANYDGIAALVSEFEDPSETPPAKPIESVEQVKARRRAERDEARKPKQEEAQEEFDPANDPKIKGDPYKTLFVSRISYETTEAKLKKEFEQYGPVRARHPRPSVPRPTEASSAPPRSHHGLAPSHRAVADQAAPSGVQHGHRQAARLRLPRV